eukprot:258742-Rhodomonas_salina.2
MVLLVLASNTLKVLLTYKRAEKRHPSVSVRAEKACVSSRRSLPRPVPYLCMLIRYFVPASMPRKVVTDTDSDSDTVTAACNLKEQQARRLGT